jgi:hypothetical protein
VEGGAPVLVKTAARDAYPYKSSRDVGDRHTPDISRDLGQDQFASSRLPCSEDQLTRAFHDSSIVLRFEMISRARSWFIFSNTGCDANRATTLPGISY